MDNMGFVLDYLARWGHFLFGIAWIGLLYYFNFVQGEYFKEADASARVDVFSKLVPRAMWYFRWAAAFTFLTGVWMLAYRHPGWTLDITVGATLGTLMFLNVWLIIWPNQKIMIASNQQIKGGGQALPEAAAAAPKAGLASRTNVLFSIPMLFFMGASAHFAHGGSDCRQTTRADRRARHHRGARTQCDLRQARSVGDRARCHRQWSRTHRGAVGRRPTPVTTSHFPAVGFAVGREALFRSGRGS